MHYLPPVLCTEQPAEESILIQFNQQQQARAALSSPILQQEQYFLNSNNKDVLRSNDTPAPEKKKGVSIIQYFHIRHFIHSLMKKKKFLAKFTRLHFNLINDMASSFNLKILKQNALSLKAMSQTIQQTLKRTTTSTKKENTCIGKLSLRFERMINTMPLVYPDDKLKVRWDCILVLPRFYFMCLIPVDLAWTNEAMLYGYALIPTLISLVLVIIDFLFGFFCSYYENGQVVTNRKKVLLHNLTKSYGIELASTVVLVVFLILQVRYDQQVDISKDIYYLLLLFSLVQYRNILRIREQLEDALNLSEYGSSIVELVKLLCLVCYVIHIFGCLWYWVGYYGASYLNEGWLVNQEVQDENFGNQYLRAIYFSTVTMFTVGYGDITPKTQPEYILAIIFMMISSIQLSYSVNTVGAVLEKITSFKELKAKKLSIINNYMSKKQISYKLQFQVRQYLNYYWNQEQDQETDDEKKIIDQLSATLKERLKSEANSRILSQTKMISDNFSDKLKGKLLDKVVEVSLNPESVIEFHTLFKISKKTDKTLYQCLCYVESGKVESFVEDPNTREIIASTVAIYNQGQSFNEIAFLTATDFRQKFKTVEFTKLLLLTRKDFLATLKDSPLDQEKFKELEDDFNIGKSINKLQIVCQSCQSKKHQTIDCPIIHYVPEKEVIVKRAAFTVDQSREKLVRGNRLRSKKTLKTQKIVSQLAQKMYIAVTNDPAYCNIYDLPEEQLQVADPNQPTQMLMAQVPLSNGHSFIQISHSMLPQVENSPNYQKTKQFSNQNFLGAKNIKRNKVNTSKKFLNAVNVCRIAKYWQKQAKLNKKIPFITLTSLIRELQQRKAFVADQTDFVAKSVLDDLFFGEQQLLLKQSTKVEDQFEIQRDLKAFKPRDNLEQFLIRQELFQQQFQPNEQNFFQQIRSKLVKFMLHPNNYVMKYKYPQSLSSQIGVVVTDDQVKKKRRLKSKISRKDGSSFVSKTK